MREQGYLVTIKLFLPVNPKDVDSTVETAMLVQALQRRDLTELHPRDVTDVKAVYTSRPMTSAQIAETGTTEPEADPQPVLTGLAKSAKAT